MNVVVRSANQRIVRGANNDYVGTSLGANDDHATVDAPDANRTAKSSWLAPAAPFPGPREV